jgi:hypothetical protein
MCKAGLTIRVNEWLTINVVETLPFPLGKTGAPFEQHVDRNRQSRTSATVSDRF